MLTPDEIAARQFLVSLRGYDREEVAAFLREVADEVASLRARVRELERDVEVARSSEEAPRAVSPVRAETPTAALDTRDALKLLGEETTRILVAAEDSAAVIRQRAEERAAAEAEQARRESRDEIESARRTASKIVADAERRRAIIAEDIRGLESTRDRFLGELRVAMKGVQDSVRSMQSASGTTQIASGATEALGAGSAGGASDSSESDDDDPVPAAAPVPGATGAPTSDVDDDLQDIDDLALTGSLDSPDEPLRVDEATEPVEVDEDLFAAAAAVEVLDDEPEEDEDPFEADLADLADVDADDADDGDPIVLREQSLGGVRPGMLRRLKRGMQDVQNAVLDATQRGGGDAEAMLPSEDDLADLAATAQLFLSAAYRAGLNDGAELEGAELGEDEVGDPARVPASAATFQSVLAHEIRSTLAPSLRAGIEAGEPATSLSERVGEVFRDLKGPIVEQLVDEHMLKVYASGMLDMWRARGVSRVRWVLGDESRCPENRCRTNATEGPVAPGDEFASGDRQPPAHDGCTCALLPART